MPIYHDALAILTFRLLEMVEFRSNGGYVKGEKKLKVAFRVWLIQRQDIGASNASWEKNVKAALKSRGLLSSSLNSMKV